jgi:hypothetical protein
MGIKPHGRGAGAMTDREPTPSFVELNIADMFMLRFVLQSYDEEGQPVYAMTGNREAFETMQDHLDHVFPRIAIKS